MTAVNITMPMIQCSSCNACIAHLTQDYARMLIKINHLISIKHDFTKAYPTDDFVSSTGKNIYTDFLQVYYLHADAEDLSLFDNRVLVIYGLLEEEKLTPSDFPFRSIVRRYKWCCTRMFLCDPTIYNI